jgi:hypothetical protein
MLTQHISHKKMSIRIVYVLIKRFDKKLLSLKFRNALSLKIKLKNKLSPSIDKLNAVAIDNIDNVSNFLFFYCVCLARLV